MSAAMDKGRTLTEIASDLNVSDLIEGEVRRDEHGIEVRIALISGQSGTEVWSDRLNGSIEDFFESRKVIGANVIAAISRALGLTASPAPSGKMTRDREAYALYLQGRAMVQRIQGDEVYVKAIEFFEQALTIDPEFAECWTALANAHIMRAAITPSLKRVEQSAEAARCGERAIAFDPGRGHAFSILGIHEWTQFNPARGLEMAFEAHARDPVYARNYTMLASAWLSLGDYHKAEAAGQRMTDLGSPAMWLALAQMAACDFEKAVQSYYDIRSLFGTIIMRPPGMPPMDDAARDAYFAFAARGICSGKEADRAAYCQSLDGLHTMMPDPHDSSIAFPAIWMGHTDLVMKIYSECIHPANMLYLMVPWPDTALSNHMIRHSGIIDFAELIGTVEVWERFG